MGDFIPVLGTYTFTVHPGRVNGHRLSGPFTRVIESA